MASGVFSIRQQAQAAGHGAWSGSQTTPFVEYLVVAGGGGAAGTGEGSGFADSGGGGAGGLLQGIVPITASSPLTVTVGSGGSGGAAGVHGTSGTTGGAGGSGIVVIRYPSYLAPAASTTGSPTTYIAGLYRVYIFYASGTITF